MEMQKEPDVRSGERVLSADEFAGRLGIAKSTLYKEIKAGRIKQGIRVTPGLVGWPESEVSEWIEQRKRERDARLEHAA